MFVFVEIATEEDALNCELFRGNLLPEEIEVVKPRYIILNIFIVCVAVCQMVVLVGTDQILLAFCLVVGVGIAATVPKWYDRGIHQYTCDGCRYEQSTAVKYKCG